MAAIALRSEMTQAAVLVKASARCSPSASRSRKPSHPSGRLRIKRQEGSEIVVTRSGCRRGRNLRRVHASRERPRGPMRCFGTEHVHADRNVANPMSGPSCNMLGT
jgi:hypothetical protein